MSLYWCENLFNSLSFIECGLSYAVWDGHKMYDYLFITEIIVFSSSVSF